MKLYVCGLPIRFPSSEYGGLVVVMAKNTRNLGKMLKEQYQKDAGAYFDLDLAFDNCRVLDLDPARQYQEGIVQEFRT